MREYFKGLFGNDELRVTLGRNIETGKASHAYIIEGPAGSGKKTLAVLASAALSCANRQTRSLPLPCGECAVCRRILKGVSTDVITVTKEDKASIGVDRVRGIREDLYVTPNDSDRKVYIISEADKMTPQAQNALLISLEEPPPFVTFFLITEDSTKLLETVKSRSMTLRTELFDGEKITEWLSALPGAERIVKSKPELLEKAIEESGGALGEAKRILFGAKRDGEEKRAAEFARKLVAGDVTGAADTASPELSLKSEEARSFLVEAARAVRDMIAVKSGSVRSDGETAEAAGASSVERLVAVFDELKTAIDRTLSNVTTRTVFYDLIFSCKK